MGTQRVSQSAGHAAVTRVTVGQRQGTEGEEADARMAEKGLRGTTHETIVGEHPRGVRSGTGGCPRRSALSAVAGRCFSGLCLVVPRCVPVIVSLLPLASCRCRCCCCARSSLCSARRVAL